MVALLIGEHQRHVRLAEYDRAGCVEPDNRDSIRQHWDTLRPGMPHVVGSPATLKDSFTVMGTPSSGPR
jgi:hypothetical protein